MKATIFSYFKFNWNGRFKTNQINNSIKSKLSKHINEKTEIIQLDKNQNKTQQYVIKKNQL